MIQNLILISIHICGLQNICKTSTEICCIQEEQKRNCDQGISIAKSGQDCPLNPITDNNLNSRSSCIETKKECCMGCQLGKIYQRNPLMCASIAKNLVNGHLKQSFFECCNVTRPTIDNGHGSKQSGNTQKCPTGYEYNAQGLYQRQNSV